MKTTMTTSSLRQRRSSIKTMLLAILLLAALPHDVSAAATFFNPPTDPPTTDEPSVNPTTSNTPTSHPSLRPTVQPTMYPTTSSNPTSSTSPTKYTRPPASEIEYPYYRYIQYVRLDVTTLSVIYNGLEYNITTWDNPGTYTKLEGRRYSNLNKLEQALIRALGFKDPLTYDCYINHHYDYSWDELVNIDIAKYFEILGYNSLTFHNNGSPSSDAAIYKTWEELTPQELNAASELCYIKGTWNKLPLQQW